MSSKGNRFAVSQKGAAINELKTLHLSMQG